MSHVAEFTIPPESFPFGRTLVEMPGIEIEMEQLVPTNQSAFPFFWVRGHNPETFMEYAEQEPKVYDTLQLESVDGTALYRAEWRPDAEVITGLQAVDVTIVEAVGTADGWRFEVRTADRGDFDQFRDVFERNGIPIDLVRIYDLGNLLEETEECVTESQRELLLAALDRGYFDTPRGTTQKELGEQFGVSSRAVSERIRRGVRNLVRSVLQSPPNR